MITRLEKALEGRYRVERELGRGSMGVVFVAHDLKHGRKVAVKVLAPELGHPGAERFLREIRTTAQLSHSHVLPLYDSGEADGLIYYVMPLVEGESLADRLKRTGALPITDALRIGREVAEALGNAHSHGIIHRDIKPSNILLDTDGHAYVADFGLARAVFSAENGRLTSTGMAVGSPQYMSPEQIENSREIDSRTDIYSLGCVVFEMLTGRPPFLGDSIQGVLKQHLLEPPPSARTFRPDVPEGVERALNRALAKSPHARFADTVQFRRALHGPRSRGKRAPMRSMGWPLSGRVGRTAGIAAAAILLVMAGLGLRGWWMVGNSVASATGRLGVAVMPISTGSDSAGEAENLFALLLAAVEVAGALEAFDGSVLSRRGSVGGPTPSWRLAREAARAGARYIVTGSSSGGRQARVSVRLFDVVERETILDRSSAVGEPPDRAVDRIGLEILQTLIRRENLAVGLPPAHFGATRSAMAMKEFLAAKHDYFEDDLDAAAEGFGRALAADSAFGLAYFYLSAVEQWRINRQRAYEVILAGVEHSESMAPKWRRLLEAQHHYLRNYRRPAQAAFQRLATDERDLPEAWWGLSECMLHFGAYEGLAPVEALSSFEHVVSLDPAFSPAYIHLTELAILANAEDDARRYLAGVRRATDTAILNIAVPLQFGPDPARREALVRLDAQERAVHSELIRIFRNDLPRVDSIALSLIRAARSPDDRRRGAQYRLAALAAQGRWEDALRAWQNDAGQPDFDAWVMHAFLAGLPAGGEALPMLRWARRSLAAGPTPDLTEQLAPEHDALRALVSVALLNGDRGEVDGLLERVESIAVGADDWRPEPAALKATLLARRALIDGDSAEAITLLQSALERLPWSSSTYTPLMDAGPQRLLLARLHEAQGSTAAAARLLRSYGASLAVGDLLYAGVVRETEQLAAGSAGPPLTPTPRPR
jgi:serine/threonine-protein kinase